MHPDLASLLLYAKQYPDDDTARLIVADWLEENGDQDGRERARYLRLQLEHAAEPRNSDRRARLDEETRALRLRHLHYWLGPFADVPGVAGGEFERGLLRLVLTGEVLSYGLERLASLPEWGWVDGVIHHGEWKGRFPKELVASPILAGLRHLFFLNADLSDGGVETLAGNPAASGLLTLSLRNCIVDATAADSLVGSEHLAGLRSLVLGCLIAPEGRQRLKERFG